MTNHMKEILHFPRSLSRGTSVRIHLPKGPTAKGRRARFTLCLAAVCTLLSATLTPGGVAASGTTPLAELTQAQSQLTTLASSAATPAVQQALTNAAQKLANASAQNLWADDNEPIAPPYGAAVFDDSRDALSDLDSAVSSLPNGGVSVADVQSVEALVVAADQGAVTQTVALQTVNGQPNVPALRGLLAAADTTARQGHGAAVAQLYGQAWTAFYGALTGTVANLTTSTSLASLMAGAQGALNSSSVTLFPPSPLTGAPLLSKDGKPEVFYIGVEACPWCGVERWALTLALSQFGTFSNLSLTESASFDGWSEGYSPINTFSFHGSSYNSPYVSFVPVEWATNQPGDDPFGLSPLQPLTPAQATLVDTYNPYCFAGGFEAGGLCGVPWIDMANRYTGFTNTTFAPIAGLTWLQIAGGLSQTGTTPTQALDGAAAMVIAQICGADGNRPASICTNPVEQQYEARING